ncbi:Alpha/Beta hydrolase protein [Spinellus fusiger]|nr:Alpha/Beta hydrolase protein [Spinellus fusiger]
MIPIMVPKYHPIGDKEIYEGLTIYSVGPKKTQKTIVVFSDFFGLTDNAKQFCDVFSKYSGYNVIMPDFFNGKYWTLESMKDVPKVIEWGMNKGTYKSTKPDIETTVEYLKSQGATVVGLIGFDWGGMLAVKATADFSIFGAASLVHPSFVDVKDAEKAGAPILALPSHDDDVMTEYMEVLSKRPFGDKCEHHRFRDMHHGFACGRGDWTNELNVKRVVEVIKMTREFFEKNLKNEEPSS